MLTLHSTDSTATGTAPVVRESRSRAARSAAALLEAFLVVLLTGVLASAAPESEATQAAPAAGVTIELDDSPAAHALAEAMPASLVFDDRMGAAQVARVDGVASAASEQTVADYRAGDVVWWPERREFVVFTHAGSGVGDARLVRIGTVGSGLADLQDCVRDCEIALTFAAHSS